MYRARWQIELVFKRLKSLAGLGHLKKHDPQAARAWLQGKLLVALLIDALRMASEAFSPWGYIELADASAANGRGPNEKPLHVAGVLVDA